jgi:hypothetical protein
MDEDVVLTVGDSVISVQQPPLPSIEMEPAFFIPSASEPTPLPSMEMEPTPFIASVPEPTPPAESIEAAPESSADYLQAFEVERAELEVEPLVVGGVRGRNRNPICRALSLNRLWSLPRSRPERKQRPRPSSAIRQCRSKSLTSRSSRLHSPSMMS